jgi:dihydroorotase
MNEIIIRRPDDFHVHLRHDETPDKMTQNVLPYTAGVFARALAMPNLTDIGLVITCEHVRLYRDFLFRSARNLGFYDFEPLMTIRLTPNTTPEIIAKAFASGAIAAKLYPEGVTTGAEEGIQDIMNLAEVFATMQEIGMVLSVHAEKPGAPMLTAEEEYLPTLAKILDYFPRLKMVVEHISSRLTYLWVKEMPANVAATITPHHLVLTCDDVFNQPHHFCKPVAKSESDRLTLIQAATSGNPKFFLGTDSAPHPRENKECSKAAAGIFNAPVALPLLAAVFEQAGALNRLKNFVSRFGAEFYGQPLNSGTLVLEKKPWTVPAVCGNVMLFLAGQKLAWRIKT